MKTVEASGRDLNEAIENGIKILKARRDEVNHEIISQDDEETKVTLTIKEPRQ